MSAKIVLCAVFVLVGAARAQNSGRVRAELSNSLGMKATSLTPNSDLREYAALFRAEEKPEAKARLDRLDRAKLSPGDLRELSEAYVLLGYFDAGASAGRALQDREPSGTQGLKLAAFAKLKEKDYAASAALAEEALKINPDDRDAAGLLHSAKGRGGASASASTRGVSGHAPPSPAAQDRWARLSDEAE